MGGFEQRLLAKAAALLEPVERRARVLGRVRRAAPLHVPGAA